MITDEQLTLLEKYIKGSNNIVFFGGAGVSTESGIPGFIEKAAYNVIQCKRHNKSVL